MFFSIYLCLSFSGASLNCDCNPLPLPSACTLPSSGYQSPSACYNPHPSFHFYQVPLEQRARGYLPFCLVEEPPSPQSRYRTLYTRRQLEILEGVFSEKKYVTLEERNRIAKDIGVSEKQVRMWFQNRRTKMKRLASREVETEGLKSPTDVLEHLKSKVVRERNRTAMTSSSSKL